MLVVRNCIHYHAITTTSANTYHSYLLLQLLLLVLGWPRLVVYLVSVVSVALCMGLYWGRSGSGVLHWVGFGWVRFSGESVSGFSLSLSVGVAWGGVFFLGRVFFRLLVVGLLCGGSGWWVWCPVVLDRGSWCRGVLGCLFGVCPLRVPAIFSTQSVRKFSGHA